MTSGGRAIIAAVAEAFGVCEGDILGRSRPRAVTQARFATAWMLRVFPRPGGKRRSYPDVIREMGRKDHTTAIYGYDKAEALLARDPGFAECVARAGELLARMEILLPALPVPEIRTPPGRFRHVKRKNELAAGDSDARARMHGTFALGRALQEALLARNVAARETA